jgi:hypothetical protein
MIIIAIIAVALALGAFAIPQSAFADGSSCNGCAVQQPDSPSPPTTPEDAGSCSGCALPTPAPQRFADGGGNCSGCAVDQPDAPVLMPTPEDGSCSSCATPPVHSQRAAFSPIIVACATPQC